MPTDTPAGTLAYRTDIDGLRAIAIVSVVAFHVWPRALPGGFVGVDVFFVISGFLISRIIRAPGFSFAVFYRRRVRRLFPALVVVLVSTLVLGRTILAPDDFSSLVHQAVAGGLFAANLFAYTDVGYFNGTADLKPLVHLWSLGVEEQFYLAWPLLLTVALRRGGARRWVLCGALLSLALFLWLSEENPRAAFYLLPSRVWELLAGALLVDVVLPARLALTASVAGLALLGATFAFVSAELNLPGLPMLLPIAGTMLLLLSSEAWVNKKLLSATPLVWLGLISYPLYLWHWPLLSLLRNFSRFPPATWLIATVVASVVLAEMTRRLVEQPLHRWPLRAGAGVLMTAMAVVVAAAAVADAVRPPEARSTTNDACLRRFPYQPDGLWFCTLSRDASPTIVLLGDSHANHLYGGMVRTFPGEAVLSIGACMPTLNLVYPSSAGAGGVCADARFTEQSDYLKRHVLQSAGLKRVVVSAMWRTFSDSGAEIDYASGLPVSTFGPIHDDALTTYVAGIESQLIALGDIPVTLVLDSPRRGIAADTQFRRQAPFRLAIMRMAAAHPNVQVVDPMPLLCSPAWCRWDLLRDANHLSSEGSALVAAAIAARSSN